MKPFPAVLKERRRHISLKIALEEPRSDDEVSKALNNAVLTLIGEKGFAEANFSVVELKKGRAVVRSTHERLYDVLAALALVSSVAGSRARCDVIKVTGTLKKARPKQSI